MTVSHGVGSSRSLINRSVLPAIVTSILCSGCSSEPRQSVVTERKESAAPAVPPQPQSVARSPVETCAAADLSPLKLVRIDQGQMRLFVAASPVTSDQIVRRVRELETCLLPTDWGKKWSLSVFSIEGLAGYKDEARLTSFVKDGRWAKGYTAEYDAASRVLVMQPATPDSQRIVVPALNSSQR